MALTALSNAARATFPTLDVSFSMAPFAGPISVLGLAVNTSYSALIGIAGPLTDEIRGALALIAMAHEGESLSYHGVHIAMLDPKPLDVAWHSRDVYMMSKT